MSSVSGQVVLITGAARGIGAETARRLVRKGARVILVDLDAEALRAVENELGTSSATGVIADVCSLDEMEAAVAHGIERFGQIDVVMANAGIGSYGSVLVTDPAAFRRVIDVNLIGVFHTVRAALPHVIERKGYVLITSSLAAYAAAPGLVAYNASKAGVEHMANALRLELDHQGVMVGSAHMSWIDTPLVRESRDDLSAFQTMLDRLPGPLGKITSVEKCADAFIRGIEKRAVRVNVPRWVNVIRWLKPLMTTPAVEKQSIKDAAEILPLMDEEVARMGRSLSERTAALERQPAAVHTPE
jgi:NAD(P)-dependent dehydrogenase (short-subunit alcohol dehydrogenase family)